MTSWNLAYSAACSEVGVLPRGELQGPEELEALVLNGNCAERYACRVDDAEVAILCQAVAQTTCVTTIDLSYSLIGDEGSRHIAGLLKRSTSLQFLSLAYNNITARGWRLIAQSLMENTSLISLNMSGNSIGGDDPANRELGGKMVGLVLQSNRTLQTLNLQSCGLGICALIGIAQALIGHPSLLSLNIANPALSGVHDRAAASQHLAEMLQKNEVLRELDLSRSMMTDSQLRDILPALVHSPSLRVLSLSSNKLSQDAGLAVAKLLARCREFEFLNLSSNEIGAAGATAIAQALRANQGLQVLNLSHCAISENGLVAIAEALRVNTSLSQLFLWGNMWSPAAAKVFHSIKTRLEELALCDCEFQVVDGEPHVVLAECGGVRS